MSRQVFKCSKCGRKTLSIDNDIESILKEGVSDPRLVEWLKQQMAKVSIKNRHFWRCEKCSVYYMTDLNGKFIATYPSEEF